ncbi:MAG: LPXTG-site transpeptidase (sortase) family protein [Herbinix sp.]|jgi:sortase A|nr:LPXTG-site transpeptidase (sortase) family protein [Herbinix sp.]
MKKIKGISRRTWTIISVVLILTGVGVYLYPRTANLISREYTVKSITTFQDTVEAMQEQSNHQLIQQDNEQLLQKSGSSQSMEVGAKTEDFSLAELLVRIIEYNEKLYVEGQKDLIDPFSYEVSSIDLSEYGIEDDMFGYIEVPKLNVVLGIYLGATSENMSKGAVHLTQTSIPIGGEDTNAVIAAHRGSRYGEMFQHIEQLEIGDEVKITNAWETLTYRVTSIEIIAPNEIDKVLIQEGRDMVTLLSCNPYGKNTQRYVVYCDRETLD